MFLTKAQKMSKKCLKPGFGMRNQKCHKNVKKMYDDFAGLQMLSKNILQVFAPPRNGECNKQWIPTLGNQMNTLDAGTMKGATELI